MGIGLRTGTPHGGDWWSLSFTTTCSRHRWMLHCDSGEDGEDSLLEIPSLVALLLTVCLLAERGRSFELGCQGYDALASFPAADVAVFPFLVRIVGSLCCTRRRWQCSSLAKWSNSLSDRLKAWLWSCCTSFKANWYGGQVGIVRF